MPADGLNRRFPLAGRARAAQVNLVSGGGRDWINTMATRTFGLASSAWTGRAQPPRKQGLRRQAEKLLAAAAENQVDGQPPRVVFSFARAVADDVAAALRRMGCLVEGVELTLTTDRLPDVVPKLPFRFSFPSTAAAHAAMWWRPRDGSFEPRVPRDVYAHSATRRAIERAYRAADGLESEIFTLVLRGLEVVSARAPRVELPATNATFNLHARGLGFSLLASAEKGCRLVFDTATTTAAARDAVWQEFADFIEQARRHFDRSPRPPGPYQWWRALDGLAVQEGSDAIGVLVSGARPT